MSTALDELIAKARQELATPETADVEVVVGNEIIQLGFESISGRDWNNHIAVCPPRAGSTFDANIGFDVDALAERLAPLCGHQVVNGERVTIEPAMWGALFGYIDDDKGERTRTASVLAAADIRLIGTVLWGLNVHSPKVKADALKSITAQGSEEAHLARELGISIRRLNGWEPAAVTTYEYDAEGRVVRTVTVHESEWSDEERELLLVSRRMDWRGGHGHLMVEATSPEANPANSEGAYYYSAGLPVVDWAEHARAAAYERFREEQGEGQSMAGYMFPVTRIDRHPAPE